MTSRQADPADAMQVLADRLVELYRTTDPRNSALTHAERRALAEETLGVWWEVYNQFAFWAQCELVGQDILQQRNDLLVMLRDRNKIKMDAERRLAEDLGFYFSVADKAGARKKLISAVSRDHFEAVELFAKAGLVEPADPMEKVLSYNAGASAYFGTAATSPVNDNGASGPQPEHDLDQARPSDITNWKLEASRQVRALVGRGLRKMAALSDVATAIRHSIDDLQQWERDLVKFGDYENDLFCAELVGEFDDQLRASHYTNIRNYKFYGSFNGVYNLERAAQLARHMRQMRMSDIQHGLRGVH